MCRGVRERRGFIVYKFLIKNIILQGVVGVITAFFYCYFVYSQLFFICTPAQNKIKKSLFFSSPYNDRSIQLWKLPPYYNGSDEKASGAFHVYMEQYLTHMPRFSLFHLGTLGREKRKFHSRMCQSGGKIFT